MSEDLVLRRSSSPAPVPLPDDDDLLPEILVGLPPLPSSLPRTSLVCKRWLRLLSDPQFLRQFRAHHREPPLLGFFDAFEPPCFTPTLDPPDRVPSERLSLAPPSDEVWNLGCRHGLVLLFNRTRLEVTVWDPVSGGQRCVAVPQGFSRDDSRLLVRHGALLCDDHHAGRMLESFKVVLLRADDALHDADPHVFAVLYESETGVWSDPISTSIKAPLSMRQPSILVGNSLCWWLLGHENGGILEFNLDRHTLTVIDNPMGAQFTEHSTIQILRMEDSRLGLAILSDGTIHLWERKANSIGAPRWMLQKTIELDKLLSVPRAWSAILGYDEDGHIIFIWTVIGVFMIQLKSMQFKNLFESNIITTYHTYTSFYTIGSGIGFGDVGAQALNNASDGCP